MLAPTDPVVRAFLERTMIVEVATLSARRRPFLTPLWFVVDSGALYLTTGPETRAAKNVVQHPEVALLFDGERAAGSDRVLRMTGVATRHRGLLPWRVLLRVAAKYYVSPHGLPVEVRNARKWRLRLRYYGQVKGGLGYVRIVPTAGELLPRP